MNASAEAYDLPARVRTYDHDMEIMHPLRNKMIDIALTILPFDKGLKFSVLDLGTGTGVFAHKLLERFPDAKVVAVDGAAAMLDLAKSRLGNYCQRVQWVNCEFQNLPPEIVKPNAFDLVISSYALHHLNRAEKLKLLTGVVKALKPGGWLLNADIVVAGSDARPAICFG